MISVVLEVEFEKAAILVSIRHDWVWESLSRIGSAEFNKLCTRKKTVGHQ